jgi:Flp pilus assembly pilin Flp
MIPSPRVREDRGASLVEYALILALITLVSLVGLSLLSDAVGDSLRDSGNSVVDADPTPDAPGG